MPGLSREAALASILVVAACAAPPQSTGLGGTSWQLVRFRGGEGNTLTPDDKGKYTFTFFSDGAFATRVDCNRGRGHWRSPAPGQVEIGPLALTRLTCAPGSLHDQIVKQLNFIRSYLIKDEHLYLSLMADGGTYELEPAVAASR
jgi:para-nitrobenzyl esterase